MSNEFIQQTPLAEALGSGVRDLGGAGAAPDQMLQADLRINDVQLEQGPAPAQTAPAPQPQEFLSAFKAPTPGGR